MTAKMPMALRAARYTIYENALLHPASAALRKRTPAHGAMGQIRKSCLLRSEPNPSEFHP